MDKVTAYRQAIKRVISAHAELGNRTAPGGNDHFTAFDDDRGLYVLIKAGWSGTHRVRGTTLFVRLHGDKIWVEEDWTQDGVASELVSAGVPREDIVLGFHPPRVRPMTEFAVA